MIIGMIVMFAGISMLAYGVIEICNWHVDKQWDEITKNDSYKHFSFRAD